jgi:hypothetical protein
VPWTQPRYRAKCSVPEESHGQTRWCDRLATTAGTRNRSFEEASEGRARREP